MADHSLLHKHVASQLESFPLLGQGAFGKVYEASGPRGEKYALKISSLSEATKKEEDYLLSEVTTLARFSPHPHIVKYVSGWEGRDGSGNLHIYLLMEFCDRLDLKSYLRQKGPPKGDDEFGSWLSHIASGLHHVHMKNILHRNLKTSNIMVNRQRGKVILKIGDFGFSRILEHPGAMAASFVGTPYYMSPEALSGCSYNCKTDIWSFGCTAFETATLKTILQAKTMRTLMSGVKKGLDNVVEENIKYSPFFRTMIGEMLDVNAANRPDAVDILQRLSDKGYNSMHSPDLGSSVSSTCSTSTSLKKSQTALPTVPELELVSPEEDNRPKDKAKGQKISDRKAPRVRSRSESDVPNLDLVLKQFSKDQTLKKIKSPAKTVTFKDQRPAVDISTDVSTSEVDTSRTDGSSGSGYETDISASGASSVYFTSPRSDYGTDEDISGHDQSIEAKRMKILTNIKKFQKKVAQAVGKNTFMKAYQTLNRQDTMLSNLEKILKDQFEEQGPNMVYLGMLEKNLQTLEAPRTLTGGNLNKTM